MVFFIPEQNLNYWAVWCFAIPAVSMLFSGMILFRIKHPFRLFHFNFIKLSDLPDNRKKPFRKDLLFYGLIFYASGVLMSVIYKRADFLTGSAGLIGSAVLFIVPWSSSENQISKEPQIKNS